MLEGKRNIYVASSWRNLKQPGVVNALKSMGHDVYDFRNPSSGNDGFGWREIDGNWKDWTVEQYIQALKHPLAEEGFKSDLDAMEWADTFVLVQPCGRSAHLELGWAVGQYKTTIMMLDETVEPELMAKMCDHICPDFHAVLDLFPNLNEEK